MFGLGKCFVMVFVWCGVKVVLIGWCVECFEGLVLEIWELGGECEFIWLDMIDIDSILNVVFEIEEKFGMLIIFINNVGILDV